MGVKAYYATVTGTDERLWENLKNGLPWPERRARAERLKDGRASRHCTGAGALLYFSLKEWGVRDFELSVDEHGKPGLKNESEVFFNISHGGDYVLCAVSDRPVGVDVEALGRGSVKIAERFFTKAECDWIKEAADEPERDDRFLRIWTRKESYSKLTGLGLKLSFNDFCVIPGEERLMEPGLEFSELLLDGHRAAVCAAYGGVNFERVNFQTQ